MKNLLIILAFSMLLAGCKTIGDTIPEEHRTVKEVEYLVRIPPKELLTLPEPVADIDVDTASQAEVAKWIINKEEYTLGVENLLRQVAEFLSKEQADADAEAEEENRRAHEAALVTPSN